MIKSSYEEKKILIWGKTTPELSTNHIETVCTGGVLEDGAFIRLYPVPFRLMSNGDKFKKYQWITARIAKSTKDNRPESRVVMEGSIRTLASSFDTSPAGLLYRSKYMFSNPKYQLESAEELLVRQEECSQSLGVVQVEDVQRVKVIPRKPEDLSKIDAKATALQAKNKQGDLFGSDEQDHDWCKNRSLHEHILKIDWRCKGSNCHGHSMSVLDWEAAALIQRVGPSEAEKKVSNLLHDNSVDLKFFLGNLKAHQASFVIGGLWYWKVAEQASLEL